MNCSDTESQVTFDRRPFRRFASVAGRMRRGHRRPSATFEDKHHSGDTSSFQRFSWTAEAFGDICFKSVGKPSVMWFGETNVVQPRLRIARLANITPRLKPRTAPRNRAFSHGPLGRATLPRNHRRENGCRGSRGRHEMWAAERSCPTHQPHCPRSVVRIMSIDADSFNAIGVSFQDPLQPR